MENIRHGGIKGKRAYWKGGCAQMLWVKMSGASLRDTPIKRLFFLSTTHSDPKCECQTEESMQARTSRAPVQEEQERRGTKRKKKKRKGEALNTAEMLH